MNETTVKSVSTSTPWGKANFAASYCRGVTAYSTPSHGGMKVSAGLNKRIPEPLRVASGWYEEDCDAAIVVFFLDKEVGATREERDEAYNSIEEWHYDALMAYGAADGYEEREHNHWRNGGQDCDSVCLGEG